MSDIPDVVQQMQDTIADWYGETITTSELATRMERLVSELRRVYGL